MVSPPVVGKPAADFNASLSQQNQQPPKTRVRPSAKQKRHHLTCIMIFDPRQRPTVKASADSASFVRKTTARQLLSECVNSLQCVGRPGLQRRRFELFFKCAHHCVHVNAQHSGGIPNAAPIEGHINDLFFDTWLVGPLVIIELESALTDLTAIALMTMSAKTFTPDSFGFTTVATRDDDSYHTLMTTCPPSSHDPQSQKIEALKTHKKGLMQQLFPTVDNTDV